MKVLLVLSPGQVLFDAGQVLFDAGQVETLKSLMYIFLIFTIPYYMRDE